MTAPADDPALVPPPAHPTLRRASLPGQRPKPQEDDPAAPEAVKAILRHSSYLEADQDVAFLNRSDTRGVRLQIDYLKAELLLEGHGVAHTVVVFGGTRIAEPRRRGARPMPAPRRWPPIRTMRSCGAAGGGAAHPRQQPLLRDRAGLRARWSAQPGRTPAAGGSWS